MRIYSDGYGDGELRYRGRMGGLPEPIRVRHPSTERTAVNIL